MGNQIVFIDDIVQKEAKFGSRVSTQTESATAGKAAWPKSGHEDYSCCHVWSLGESGSTAGPDPARQLPSCRVGAGLNLSLGIKVVSLEAETPFYWL